MNSDKSENQNIIYTANQEMLDFFNKRFLSDLEEVQDLKTQIFEIDIKIDELQKTKNIYAFKSSSRRSVFTPIATESLLEDESQYIQSQIKELENNKSSLEDKLRNLERALNVTKKRLATLHEAHKAIQEAGLTDENGMHSCITNTDADGFEFVEKPIEQLEQSHSYNILMLEAFNNSFLSTILKKNINDGLNTINAKLDTVPYLMKSDINRASATIDDIKKSNEAIRISLQSAISRISLPYDTSKPIWSILDDFIMAKRDSHPDCLIETNIECADYEMNLHPVFTINLLTLLEAFFDNVFKHAQANQIDFKLSLTPNVIDVVISDNGIGIKETYLSESPWYSSIHRAIETIYLLGGNLDIKGNTDKGTTVRFNFSIKK